MLVSQVSHNSRIPCTARFQMGTTARGVCACLGGKGREGGREGERERRVGGDVKYDNYKSINSFRVIEASHLRMQHDLILLLNIYTKTGDTVNKSISQCPAEGCGFAI